MKSLLIANWKMNQNHRSAADFFATFAQESSKVDWKNLVEVGIAPPYPYLEAVGNRSHDLGLLTGAQNVHQQDNGAYTGEIGAAMLKDIGCEFVIVGHSERRTDHGETDDLVRAKVEAAIAAGLKAVICIGETEAERDAGKTIDVVRTQVQGSVPAVASAVNSVVAYEPVWAIGTGRTPTTDEVQEVHALIRNELAGIIGAHEAEGTRLLYGGSMKPENAKELLALADVDGGLIGGASLKADDFWAIGECCS